MMAEFCVCMCMCVHAGVFTPFCCFAWLVLCCCLLGTAAPYQLHCYCLPHLCYYNLNRAILLLTSPVVSPAQQDGLGAALSDAFLTFLHRQADRRSGQPAVTADADTTDDDGNDDDGVPFISSEHLPRPHRRHRDDDDDHDPPSAVPRSRSRRVSFAV